MREGEKKERARGENGETEKDGGFEKQSSFGQSLSATIQDFTKKTNDPSQ